MSEKPQTKQLSKQRLAIQHMELDVPYSQGTKFLDRVQAVNMSLPDGDPLTGKPLRMTIFNKAVKDFVRGKTDIVADVEERTRPDSEYAPDRTIVQVYEDNGEPVSKKQGGGYRRSLEDDLALEAVKRRSIEGQTAVAQVGALLMGKDVDGESLGIDEDTWFRILGKYWKAVEKGLDNYLEGTTPVAPIPRPLQGGPDNAGKAVQKTQGGQQGGLLPEKVSEDGDVNEAPVKHVGDLLTRANNIGVSRAEVTEVLGMEAKDVGDLNEAWKKILLHAKNKAAVQ